MHHDLDPARLTPDERRQELAAIFATGLRRLRDRAALTTTSPVSEILPEAAESSLEAVADNSLSEHVG
jgi:hypothetical protein